MRYGAFHFSYACQKAAAHLSARLLLACCCWLRRQGVVVLQACSWPAAPLRNPPSPGLHKHDVGVTRSRQNTDAVVCCKATRENPCARSALLPQEAAAHQLH